MSHPFSLDYTMGGEMLSTQLGKAGAQGQETHEDSQTYKSQIKPSPSTRICDSKTVNDGCQTNPDGEHSDALEKIKEEMNIDITDEDMSFFKIIRMASIRRLSMFAQEAAIVGLSYLVKPSSHKIGLIIRKVIWTLLLLFGVGFMFFQIYDRISYYLTYPTNVNYRVAYNRSLRFPTVTICPETIFSKKALPSIGLLSQNIVSLRFPPMLDVDFTKDSNVLYFLKGNLDWEFLYEYLGTKMEDMLLECSFQNLPCNSSEVIKKKIIQEITCFSFNPVTAKCMTIHPGATYGLRLVLWVNQSDSLAVLSPGVGFRVALRDTSDMYAITTFGIRVGTGIATSISFSLRNVSMLPAPYGDCRQSENYTSTDCMWTCLAWHMISECNCRTTDFYVPGVKVCFLSQELLCVLKYGKWFVTSGESGKCDCPLQCNEATYPYSISTSPLSQHFLNYMSRRSQFKGRNLTMSKLSKELVYVDIFYSQLSYIDIQMTPAFDFLTLVCDTGGAVGLILGGTILTIVEFLQCLVELLQELITSAKFAKMQRG